MRPDINQLIKTMTLRQKLGQLIVSRPMAEGIEENVAKGEIGGLYVTNKIDTLAKLKEISPFPLLVAQDLEAGKTVDGPIWPDAMSVSSADSLEDAYLWAFLQGKQARSFGVNAVFGPVLDIALCDRAENTGYRTVGSVPSRVADYCAQMVRGYQDAGVLPFAKHYPGFGRAVGDPHMELSRIDVDAETLFSDELLPYRKAIQEQHLMGVMSGHVLAKRIDEFPSTVSKRIIDLLRNDLAFDGLLITDSLAMQGILQYDNSQYLYENTILAGHDLLLANYRLPDAKCLDYLEEAVKEGRLPLALVEEKVRRVLTAKYRLEEQASLPWSAEENNAVFDRIGERAPSYVRSDGKEFLPLKQDESVYCIFFTDDQQAIDGELSNGASMTGEIFHSMKQSFPNMRIDMLPLCPTSRQIEGALSASLEYSKVIVVARTLCGCYTGFDALSYQAQAIIRSLSHRLHSLVIWGTPFSCKPVLAYVPQVLFIYDSRRIVLDRLLKGSLKPNGKLPVSLL